MLNVPATAATEVGADPDWFLVQSKPRQEGQAEQRLAEQGFAVYLPRLRRPRRRQSRWADVVEPLFPRYLFVGLVCGEQSMAPIRSTPGVGNIVRFGSEYRAVPTGLVAALRARERDGLHQLLLSDAIRPGDLVRVEEGPFAGLTGVFRSLRGEDRALVLLDLLGQQSRIELPQGYLTRLSVPALAAGV